MKIVFLLPFLWVHTASLADTSKTFESAKQRFESSKHLFYDFKANLNPKAWPEFEERKVDADVFVFMTHVGPLDVKSTKSAVERLASTAQVNSLPIFVAVRDYENGKLAPFYNYVREDMATNLVFSLGGAHNLEFPNGKMAILAGGYFQHCFCESFRDIVRGLSESAKAKDVSIFMITDAIYESESKGAEFFSAEEKILYKNSKPTHSPSKSLDSLIQKMTEESLVGFLRSTLVDEKQDIFCPDQFSNTLKEQKEMVFSKYTLDVFKRDKRLASIGTGATPIKLVLSSNAHLEGILAARKAGAVSNPSTIH